MFWNDGVVSDIINQENDKMRVIAGKARRIPLVTVKGMETRPTTDRTKETLFNMIAHGLCDCTFLDLFSGSGAIGIEAISRGVKKAVFVENNPNAIQCIMENLKKTQLADQAKVIREDVFSALRRLDGREKIDYVFMDPPYNHMLEKEVLTYLAKSDLLEKDALIIVEASLATDFSYLEELGFLMIKQKKYKTNMHVFISVEE